MQETYSPEEIELKVQQHWDRQDTFKVTEERDKEKYYCLSMLPYPSGRLHMGHVRNYTIGDVIARHQRMLGKNVLQPIGWDAFGLPAEGAAIKNKIAPACWTYSNIDYMKKQLKRLGFSFDWSREITTCRPEYYRWEQWFFTCLYNKGLVYKKTSLVNWCPQDNTVLANEQVINGFCWRCDTKVDKKEIPQWFVKITAYADQLLSDLDTLEDWPEKVKTMQRNWIGYTEGAEITFQLLDRKEKLTLYTTRPDTLMGITYLAIPLSHTLSLQAATDNIALKNFIQKSSLSNFTNIEDMQKNNLKKQGMATGLYALHPLTNAILPIWMSNYMVKDDFSYAVMGVPGHNQCDFEFARKYNLPVKAVIRNDDGSEPDLSLRAMTKKGILFNSGIFDGLDFQEAFNAVIDVLSSCGVGEKKTYYRLRDWCISRQRYWGAPIPMITLIDGTVKPIPDDQLPVILPEDVVIDGISNPLNNDLEWIKTSDNGEIAFRETDTFDTFMESSWYYARYTCPDYNFGMLDPEAANYWLPVDQYIGGVEHAILHLMYFRFYHKLLRDQGLVTSSEPAQRLLCQGMVLADTFYDLTDQGERVWISPSDVRVERDKKGKIIKAIDSKGNALVYAGISKMSKSKNNGIDPQDMVKKYGADTVRLFIMFAASPELNLEWQESGIEGVNRFLKRIWRFVYDHHRKGPFQLLDIISLNYEQKSLRRDIHKTIVKVTEDIGRRRMFNTAIASIMELMNQLVRFPSKGAQNLALLHEAMLVIVRLLYPFTPHICFILWNVLGGEGNIDHASWPVADKAAIVEEHNVVIVQINGKLRGKIIVPKDADEALIRRHAFRESFVEKHLEGSTVRKMIYIPGKLLNLVLD
ncbi:leucyl-tRNA synthetase [secondary endosymbiont of Heteropsylla cubana]|uniref:Leucine--tRNA ligase n=1 Tax=secondary endosymbiont of Heteropsylla cubana TaxID=134287 RepID=J3TYS7_9ENTR|nr:leucine--tRNA ligase [secondary endosymbiont of Heteropsylla cubana]AFP85575.1 leucyl-tRNA synthetase [secondary endosymbiont of Heteropsylla cubana]